MLMILYLRGARYWPRFCKATGLDEWCHPDHPYSTVRGRARRRDEIVAALQPVFAAVPLAEWLRRLGEAGCIHAPVQTLAEVCADPQLRENGAFATVHHPTAGQFQTVAAPFNVHGGGVHPRGPAPDPGEHTEAVLKSLGLGEGEIAHLHQSGAVGFVPVPHTPLSRWTAKL
jgi:crotonobetainyl-CoA:carnitine CoA-transferase CaiB-like acyl-CoA transferase